MKRRAEKIDSVVRSVITKLDKEAGPTSDDIEKIWGDVAGSKALKHSKPVSLRKKRLVVNIDGSGWLYELTLKKDKLLSRLQKRLGRDKVENLQFRIGEL